MGVPKKKRILIVEDAAHIAEGLQLNLTLKGYDAVIAQDGIDALRQWKDRQPDLIVLDIMLPGIDGLSVLRSIRLEDERIPILILSAKSDSHDKVESFLHGVDDYLAKPFHLEEFLLRVERLLTRVSWNNDTAATGEDQFSSVPQVYQFGNNRIDFGTLIAHSESGKFNLTPQEAKLLKLFIINRGKPLSRDKLLEIVWGYARGTSTRTVDNYLVRFRKYFEKNSKKPVFFKSLRSVGYVFDPGSV